jgi:hypothetical protein
MLSQRYIALTPGTTACLSSGSLAMFVAIRLASSQKFAPTATIRILLYAIQEFIPDDFGDPQFFWIVILVMIPFVMLIYFGLAIIICNEITARSGRPTVLPLELSSRKIVPATVTYIGLTLWVWLPKRRISEPAGALVSVVGFNVIDSGK